MNLILPPQYIEVLEAINLGTQGWGENLLSYRLNLWQVKSYST